MTSATLYRVSAVIFVLFAAGHTFGFLSFKPPTAEGIAVRDAMSAVHFTVDGSTFSYGNFYRGFGLSATVSMLFQAFLAWQLASIARLAPGATARVGWGLCAVQLVGFGLSYLYFSLAPAIFSLALGVCLGVAAWRSEGQKVAG
jgi:hypothetical protein